MNMNYYLPVRLVTGKGCVAANAPLLAGYGKKCLIVTGKRSAKRCGALDDVTGALASAEVAYEIFDGISQNPKFSECLAAAKKAIASGADFILGIGGGSPLDAAKCIAVLAANPGMDEAVLYSYRWPADPLPIVCVGTTAGTGSEVTKVSVITKENGRKTSFNEDRVYPALSLGDASYTVSLDEGFTRSTAIDALMHCVESYFSRKANEISRCYALEGVRLLMPMIRKINGKGCGELTFEDREQIYCASIYGGMAINTTGTCMPHAMGYFLSEEYQVPHGIACAVYLEEFMHMTRDVKPELVKKFLEDLDMGFREFIHLTRDFLPETDIKVSEDMIAAVHGRWAGNGSLAKSWPEILPEKADEIIRKLFA